MPPALCIHILHGGVFMGAPRYSLIMPAGGKSSLSRSGATLRPAGALGLDL